MNPASGLHDAGATMPKEAKRMSDKRIVVVLLLLVGLAAGWVIQAGPLSTQLTHDHSEAGNVAYAAPDCAPPLDCEYGLAQSALTVRHLLGQGSATDRDVLTTNLSTETWNIGAFYYTEDGDPNCITCETASFSCTVTVQRQGTSFALTGTTCNKASNPTGPFTGATLVTDYACGTGAGRRPHSYKFAVTTADKVVYTGCVGGETYANLGRVEYSVSNPPNGQDMDLDCTPVNNVSPEYSTYRTNDRGDFECTPGTPYGPEIGITYD